MELKNLSLQKRYRTNDSDIVNDFYIPCLAISSLYQRAVGYFTSGGLIFIARGISHFINNNGKIQLVASPYLDEKDVDSINRGYKKKDDAILASLVKELERLETISINEQTAKNLSCLTALVASGRMEIKLALPVDEKNKYRRGIYHEKIGILSDSSDHKVAFTGSSNETAGGLMENFESIYVFRSWNDPEERVSDIQNDFDFLWQDKTSKIKVISFPEAAKDQLIKVRIKSNGGYVTSVPGAESKANKWIHQSEALEKFLQVERGILDMATGTGKTRTAIEIIIALYESKQIETVIISTEGNDLLDQWYREVLALRNKTEIPLRIYRHYKQYKESQDFLLNQHNGVLLASRNFVATALREIDPDISSRTILIHDEVHGLGSPGNREKLANLSEPIRYRLGLSATPEREYDREGVSFIEKHIGPVIFKFGLNDAIERGILAPFNYHPLRYSINNEDRERLANIYAKRARREKEGNPMSEEEVWIEIARVYKTSREKIPIFENFIKENRNLLERCIVFVETQEYGREVLEIIHQFRYDFHTYFSGQESQTLQAFARNNLECLITCHRLSEGIDIQSLNTVILFSSARSRLETIQRIGRCLRINPDNPSKIANIVDFIRNNDDPKEQNADDERCNWLTEISKIRPKETHHGN